MWKLILNLIKKFFGWLVDLWNIYGGIAISSLIVWWTGYSKTTMDNITSYIVLTFTIVSVLTVLKKHYGKGKLTKTEKAIAMQPTMKAIGQALDPLESGTEISETIIKTTTILERLGKFMKTKIKNFFKRVWGNKATITNITINLVAVGVMDYLTFSNELMRFSFFANNELVLKIVIPILSVIYLMLDIFTTVSKYGWETLEELRLKAEAKAEAKASALTAEQRTVLKTQIKYIKSAIEDYAQQLKAFEEIIKNYEILSSLGIAITPEKSSEYQNAVSQTSSITVSVEQLKTELERLENMLAQ